MKEIVIKSQETREGVCFRILKDGQYLFANIPFKNYYYVKTEDYEAYDTFGNTMPLTWLKWADKDTHKLFYRIDKYGKLLTHSDSTSAIRTLGKKFFYYLAKFRFKHRFFAFPFELFFLFKFNRYYNPKCKI